MQYAIAHLDPNEDNPSMEENPCINVDFETKRNPCLEAATMMMDEGYKMVTPFSLRMAAKRAHILLGVCQCPSGCPYQIMFHVVV